jgi:hypothetical protein
VTENEVPAFYSTCAVCINFYKPLVARSYLIGADFPTNWRHRVIQTNEDVTENEVPAFYSAYCVCISFAKPLVATSHLIGVDFLAN